MCMCISCVCHVCIMCVSCVHHVCIMCVSCVYHVSVVYIVCVCVLCLLLVSCDSKMDLGKSPEITVYKQCLEKESTFNH